MFRLRFERGFHGCWRDERCRYGRREYHFRWVDGECVEYRYRANDRRRDGRAGVNVDVGWFGRDGEHGRIGRNPSDRNDGRCYNGRDERNRGCHGKCDDWRREGDWWRKSIDGGNSNGGHVVDDHERVRCDAEFGNRYATDGESVSWRCGRAYRKQQLRELAYHGL